MLISMIFSLVLQGQAYAGESSAAPQADDMAKAVQETQSMMADPKAIEAYAKEHPDAKAADDQVKSLTGGNAQDTADIYKLASQIMGSMATASGGDPAKMNLELMKALKNPSGFAATLTPEQQSQLKALAGKVDARAPSAAPH